MPEEGVCCKIVHIFDNKSNFVYVLFNVRYTCMPFIYVDMHLKTILVVSLFSIIL